MNLVHDVLSHVRDPLNDVETGLRVALNDASPEAQRVVMHLANSGGKRVRPMLAILSAQLFDGEGVRAIPVGVASELIHMATLVHDDVIDHASIRRGRKTVNNIWGNHISVLAGDALLAKSLIVLVEQTKPEVVKLMSQMIYRMCEGEIAQHASMYDMSQDVNAYFDRIEKKTALFFAACCEAGALMGGADSDAVRMMWAYGRYLGMAFQVIDDLLDVNSDAQVVGKPVGNDIASGVITLPVLYAINNDHFREEAMALISKKEEMTQLDIDRLLTIVKDSGALEYTFSIAEDFSRKAIASLSQIPDSETKRILLAIAKQALSRDF